MNAPPPITVAIVEDKREDRELLLKLIAKAPDLRCLASYANAEEAVRGLTRQAPDVILMDIKLPGASGIECVVQLRARGVRSDIVMITVIDDSEELFAALSAGAISYVLKSEPGTKIVEAIREARRGGSVMSAAIARKVIRRFQHDLKGQEQLTDRQREVLHHLATGKTYKEIAEALVIGYDGVRAHLRNIYEKLQVHSRGEAVAKFRND
ncbi:MAG: response regulator transcription factor [Chloroflexi bacterium]|nr:response regulator transcription factor [Chloroflexota bacterium]